eukprot:2218987-Pyramimonas_sp.AAC.1
MAGALQGSRGGHLVRLGGCYLGQSLAHLNAFSVASWTANWGHLARLRLWGCVWVVWGAAGMPKRYRRHDFSTIYTQ